MFVVIFDCQQRLMIPEEDDPLFRPGHPTIYTRPALTCPPLESVSYRHPTGHRRYRFGLYSNRRLRPLARYSSGSTCASNFFDDIFEHFGPCSVHPDSNIYCFGGNTEFINHSENPNARIHAGRGHSLVLEIIREIPPHSEILIDYGAHYTTVRLLARRNAP